MSEMYRRIALHTRICVARLSLPRCVLKSIHAFRYSLEVLGSVIVSIYQRFTLQQLCSCCEYLRLRICMCEETMY
jgi:hypothetical protein